MIMTCWIKIETLYRATKWPASFENATSLWWSQNDITIFILEKNVESWDLFYVLIKLLDFKIPINRWKIENWKKSITIEIAVLTLTDIRGGEAVVSFVRRRNDELDTYYETNVWEEEANWRSFVYGYPKEIQPYVYAYKISVYIKTQLLHQNEEPQ